MLGAGFLIIILIVILHYFLFLMLFQILYRTIAAFYFILYFVRIQPDNSLGRAYEIPGIVEPVHKQFQLINNVIGLVEFLTNQIVLT